MSGADLDQARQVFGEFFDGGDDDYEEEIEEEGGERVGKEIPQAARLEDLYEPALIEQFYMSSEDDKIRRCDQPERMQVEMQGRWPVSSVEEVSLFSHPPVHASLHTSPFSVKQSTAASGIIFRLLLPSMDDS